MKDYLPSIFILLGTITAASIGAYYALKNLKTNNVINARIEWLKQLKVYVADFVSSQYSLLRITNEVSELDFIRVDPKPEGVEPLNNRILNKMDDFYNIRANLNRVQSLLHLNLNSNEKLHSRLEAFLKQSQEVRNKIDHIMFQISTNDSKQYNYYKNAKPIPSELAKEKNRLKQELEEESKKFDLILNSIIDISKSIFKIEWEKCKSGKVSHWKKREIKNLEFNKYIKSLE